jgi:hypothetical protein
MTRKERGLYEPNLISIGGSTESGYEAKKRTHLELLGGFQKGQVLIA